MLQSVLMIELRKIPTLPIAILWMLLALVAAPSSSEAQFDRLRNAVAGVEKGEIYGLDLEDTDSSVVFVVDLTPVIELPPGAADNLRSMVAQHGEAYVRQKLAAEGTDWMLRAAGPAGMAVRVVMAQRKDRAERARNHTRAAIEGLDDDQMFGLVTFEAGPATWHQMAAATRENRDEARDFLGDLQKAEGDGFLRNALLAAAGMGLESALGGAAGAQYPGMNPAAGMAGTDPAAMQAMMAAAGAGGPQAQAAMAAAALSASQSQAGMPAAGTVPAAPTVSADDLLQGIGMALELEPEIIVIVVGSAPAQDSGEFVARVAELVAGRTVTIHTAVFGEDQPGGVLRDLAAANTGKLLTENKD